MVRSEQEMVREIRSNLRGGQGDIEFIHLFTQEEMGSKTRLFAKIILPPGGSIGFHEHHGEEEIYFILKGSGLANDNGQEVKVGPGDAVLTGGGAGHSIENVGEGPLEMVAAVLMF
ncbi:MAG: cupin domain-containing protein [Limnochordia bacterium]|jgi:mannose-6-phosphate isomerase-like protein (cupin superfamily)